jgi:hypothetical protein
MPSGSRPWTFDASWGCEVTFCAIGHNWFDVGPDVVPVAAVPDALPVEVAVDAVAVPDPLAFLLDVPDVVPYPNDDLGDVAAIVLDNASREPPVVDALTGDAECVVWCAAASLCRAVDPAAPVGCGVVA